VPIDEGTLCGPSAEQRSDFDCQRLASKVGIVSAGVAGGFGKAGGDGRGGFSVMSFRSIRFEMNRWPFKDSDVPDRSR